MSDAGDIRREPAGGDIRREPAAESVAAGVTKQVRSILASADGLATALKREGERQAEARMKEAELTAARRLDDAQREADELLAARVARLAELTDGIAARAEATLAKLEAAEAARTQLDRLLHELARTAERLPGDVAASEEERKDEWRARAAEPMRDGQPAGVAIFDPERRHARRQPAAQRPAAGRAEAGRTPDSPVGLRSPVPSPDSGTHSFDVARQVATEMAVAGGTRGEVAAHLQRTFRMADPHLILNEAFADRDDRS